MEFKNPQVTSRRTYSLLLLILLITPCFSKDEFELKSGEEIDQIDYKGPETHPFIPPPSNKFGPHSSTTMLDLKSKDLLQSQSTNRLAPKGASFQGNVHPQKP